MIAVSRRAVRGAMVLGWLAALTSLGQRVEAQQPIRPALPARPNINLPQPQNARPNNNPNPGPAVNSSDGGFDNPGFRPVQRSNRNFNGQGYNPWNSWGYNDWNMWNSYAIPYVSISTVNPALNGFGVMPNWQAWNNPFLMNANMNPMWNNFGVNPMWNNYNLNFGFNPFAYNYGLPVGNWNAFTPQMLFPNWNGMSQELPR